MGNPAVAKSACLSDLREKQNAPIAALILAFNPSLSADQVKSLIMDNVDPLVDLDGITVTGGRLNVFQALEAASASETFFVLTSLESPGIRASALTENDLSRLTPADSDSEARWLTNPDNEDELTAGITDLNRTAGAVDPEILDALFGEIEAGIMSELLDHCVNQSLVSIAWRQAEVHAGAVGGEALQKVETFAWLGTDESGNGSAARALHDGRLKPTGSSRQQIEIPTTATCHIDAVSTRHTWRTPLLRSTSIPIEAQRRYEHKTDRRNGSRTEESEISEVMTTDAVFEGRFAPAVASSASSQGFRQSAAVSNLDQDRCA